MPGMPPSVRVDIYPTRHYGGFALRPGFPLPLGAIVPPCGVNFAVYSRDASTATLVLFEPGDVASMDESLSLLGSAMVTSSP